MRIGMHAPRATSLFTAVTEMTALEDAGLDMIVVPEIYGFDAVSQLGYLAGRTSTVTLVAGILPIYTRTPALMAMTAAGLDFVSGGRFVLGLGTSGPQVIEGFHGVPFDAPLERTRELVRICRSAWRQEVVRHDGAQYQIPAAAGTGTGLGRPLKLMDTPVRPDIPVLIAAMGPRNVELAAEIADLWQPAFLWPERAGDVWAGPLASGQARRDPARSPLRTVISVPAAVGEKAGSLADRARPGLALYIGGMGAPGRNFYADLAGRYGFAAEAAVVQELYLSGRKAEAAAVVPQELVQATSLIGPPGYVAERLAAFAEAGVDTINVIPVQGSSSGRRTTMETLLDLTR